jgi:hypothetical protein
MRKLTKADYQKLEAQFVKLEKENFVIFFDRGSEVTSWFDKNTYAFAKAADYDRLHLEEIASAYALEVTRKITKGMSLEQMIALAESTYSDHDKAVLASHPVKY